MLSDSLNLHDRVAIITGASRGIGRATAKRLVEAGANVVINYVRDEEGALQLLKEVEAAGGRALPVQGDVRNLSDAERIVNRAIEEFGGVDILICNAGVWEGAPIERMGEDVWARTMDINLKGTWTMCRAVLPFFKECGRIVVVSSTAGQRGEANYSNYAAAKGGQISFVKSLAVELAPRSVNVNAIAPGWVDTEMTALELADPARRAKIEKAIPLGRVATADDVALPILFLCSDWARHITGEVLSVNGGSVLCG
ncbi:MAG: 3-oxoacyl-[acyl-carrier protein] reductase [Acidobacteriota bacterium]|nr:3-oxoacyl-[acyl-carrier protein] reductase [Acidobacteriota bacterium]